MKQQLEEQHITDDQGKPAGGTTRGLGISIDWQNGPLGRGVDRILPNGAFVEGVIAAALAITKLEEALHWCQHRTADRESREVEGTHQA
jgi:hypothetical protein